MFHRHTGDGKKEGGKFYSEKQANHPATCMMTLMTLGANALPNDELGGGGAVDLLPLQESTMFDGSVQPTCYNPLLTTVSRTSRNRRLGI